MADDNSEALDDSDSEKEFDYLSTVKVLLGIQDDSSDGILRIIIALTKNTILNYCNIKELPSALNFTLCQMTAEAYRENSAKTSTGGVVGNVSSVSEDGRTVSFTNGVELKASIEDKVSHTKELNRYKRLYRL